ncbi:hypothetical protein FOA52_000966 [Chlamydomonas sp. UWO 241]|nr:hypothetical protein FOA52_000966 [Chlamydomonas sp. UWO 241]
MVGNADLVGAGCALRQAAGEGDARALEHLLRTSGYDPADLLMLTDGDGTTALMEAAMAGDHVDVMRLLLDHPCADAATILMHATHLGFTAVIAAAVSGHVDVMRLLLTHPSADPAAMMAFNADIGESALVAAAVFATGGIAGDADDYEDALPPSCAPLLFLLRRFAMQPQPCDAQEAHMSKVMEVLMAGPRSGALFDDDQPDDVRDECIRLLLEFGARGFDYNRPCVTRIVRDGLQMVQLLNEAVVGVALAQQQH